MILEKSGWEIKCNERQCNVIYNQLFQMMHIPNISYTQDYTTRKRQISDVISRNINIPFQVNYGNPVVIGSAQSLADYLIDQANGSILRDEEFSWISKDNNRLCFYVWMSVRTILFPANLIHTPFNRLEMQLGISETEIFGNQHHLYKYLHVLQSPTSNSEKIASIIDYFDLLGLSSLSKRNLLNAIHQSFSVVSTSNPLDWADDKNQECGEAIFYKLRKLRPACDFLACLGTTESYWTVLAYLDRFVFHPEQRELLIHKLKSTYRAAEKSKLHRENNKRQYNFTMNVEVHNLIKDLKNKRKAKSKNELIESLIREAHTNSSQPS